MALVSQAGSTHRIGVESIRCKGGNYVAFSVSAHMESLKMKETPIGSSLSCCSGNITHGLHIDSTRMASRRGGRVIVAASPPTEDTVVATEPLTKEDLVAYLASGCKSKEKWRLIFHMLSRVISLPSPDFFRYLVQISSAICFFFTLFLYFCSILLV